MLGHLPRFLRRFGLAGLPMYAALRSRREVRIRIPGVDAPVRLRAGTSDRSIFITTFLDEENRVEHPGTPRFIVDAGANVGLTALWLARRYPGADIVAVEPDPSNFRLLRANTAHLPRVRAIEAAVWPRPARLQVENPDAAPCARRVREVPESEPGLPAIDLASILAASGHDRIDILKLDVEGAERELFLDPGCRRWLDATDMIFVELHDRIVPGCTAALEAAIAGQTFHRSAIGGNSILLRPRVLAGGPATATA